MGTPPRFCEICECVNSATSQVEREENKLMKGCMCMPNVLACPSCRGRTYWGLTPWLEVVVIEVSTGQVRGLQESWSAAIAQGQMFALRCSMHLTMLLLAYYAASLVPRPAPSFPSLAVNRTTSDGYCKRREAGRRPGNEATMLQRILPVRPTAPLMVILLQHRPTSLKRRPML